MKISNETKVGVIAAFAIVTLILGFNFLKGESLFSKSNTYYAVYDEVDGLFRSNPVILNGYKVGHVSSVSMNHETLKLIVAVQVPNTIKIPGETILKITNNDLLGSKAVEIIMPDSIDYGTMQLAASGDTLTSQKDAGIEQALTSVLTPLSNKVNEVLIDVDSALTDVSLNSTLADLSMALHAFKVTTHKLNGVLEGKSEQLDIILGNLARISADIKSSTPKIDGILAKLDTTADELAKLELQELSTELHGAITQIKGTFESMSKGEGTLGKLATDDELWKQLNKTVTDLDLLINDIIKYPRRYTAFTEKGRKKGDKQKEFNEGIDLPNETK